MGLLVPLKKWTFNRTQVFVLWNSEFGMPVLIGLLFSLTDICMPFSLDQWWLFIMEETWMNFLCLVCIVCTERSVIFTGFCLPMVLVLLCMCLA
jgi:hypothetical protein